MDESQIFRQGIDHFNARRFFEAHEVWEELWLRAPEPEKNFLQGLIQLAAGWHHYLRGNSSGAESLLAAGVVKLSRCPETHRGLRIGELVTRAKDWAKMLGEGNDPGAGQLPPVKPCATLDGTPEITTR
jgi:predicted metal-dependent hydrolase